jgi:hypothetical protein
LCNELISLSPLAKKWFRAAWRRQPLPGHVGYQQLAIIKEKQKDYRAAIALCQQALAEGWRGDWAKRIARCELRRANAVSRGEFSPRSVRVEMAPSYPIAIPVALPAGRINRLLPMVSVQSSAEESQSERPLLFDMNAREGSLESLS